MLFTLLVIGHDRAEACVVSISHSDRVLSNFNAIAIVRIEYSLYTGKRWSDLGAWVASARLYKFFQGSVPETSLRLRGSEWEGGLLCSTEQAIPKYGEFWVVYFSQSDEMLRQNLSIPLAEARKIDWRFGAPGVDSPAVRRWRQMRRRKELRSVNAVLDAIQCEKLRAANKWYKTPVPSKAC
jgi:hypothetical protein